MFKELKKNICKNNNNINVTPKHFNCDFEKAISNAFLKIVLASYIKYCIWHFIRALEIQKNKLCYKEVDEDNKELINYKIITNFPFINPEYIFDIYNKIK